MVVSPGDSALLNVHSSAAPVLNTIVSQSIESVSTPRIDGTTVDSTRLPPASGDNSSSHPAKFST
eukprot:11616041-Heterocapsa_arctica.AAC.1